MAAEKFGAYEVLYELKTGGMGAVLLARRRGPGTYEQLVAIKTIRPEFAAAAHVRSMFLDEAAILARLSHPGIARVYDFGEEGGTLYMVMEYVAGIPFRELDTLGVPAQIAARAIAEAARGVHAAHESRDLTGALLGLVHRDISPDNLLIGYDGHVKVIDFGIALVKNRQAPVTEFGMVKGKPPYMSPEQVKNESMDRRSDIFSLAVVLHEMLTHAPLFDGDSIYAIARAVEHQVIPRPSTARGEELPIGLDAVVMNALDRDVERRTPSAAKFAEDLEEVLQVAGGESLQAWIERELATPREEHRAWLAKVVAGKTDAARPIGRPTGSVTALGPEAGVQTPIAAIPAADGMAATQAAELSTHLGADTTGERPAKKSNRLVIALALIVVFAVLGGVIVMVMKGGAAEKLPIDAGQIAKATPDAFVPILAPAPVDAAPAPIEVDAAIAAPPDAPPHKQHHDARPTPDAPEAKTVAPDASSIAAPAGSGFVAVFSKEGGSYLQVMIDGKAAGPTPIAHKKLAAGDHHIQLLDPASSDVVLDRSITIEDGKTVTVRP